MINFTMLIILTICLFTDLRERKIYNIVIFPALVVAIGSNAWMDGLSGLWFSVTGFVVGFMILLIPYFMGGMGAGDVKLLALIGALKGVMFVLTTAIFMAIIGGVMGVLILLFRKGAIKRIKSILFSAACIKMGMKIPLMIDKDGLKTTYPYGVAIVGGAIISLLNREWVLLW
ncbi:prepilin peptidase [Bacillus salitolerans]|uniref:Prepilin peptidase n=1 Tax=Bacillus salitolerans TaxID=1437434 RepID=A0ABW4LJH2_9BACI